MLTEQKIKEYLFQAYQSGKQETSNLAADILMRIDKMIDEKVKASQSKLDNYISNDNEWKKNADPAIEIMKKMWAFTSVGGYILKAVILIGSTGTALWAIIKYFKKLI